MSKEINRHPVVQKKISLDAFYPNRFTVGNEFPILAFERRLPRMTAVPVCCLCAMAQLLQSGPPRTAIWSLDRMHFYLIRLLCCRVDEASGKKYKSLGSFGGA